MAKHGKRYMEAQSLIEEGHDYTPEEAISLAKQSATSKFDETVELHIRTGADPRHADQMVRGVTTLPHGVGKAVRVLVFTQGEPVMAAERAGADFVGGDDLVKKIEGGWTDFDVSIATPDMMGRIGKLGKILGRKGLMPNPRTGTVVQPQGRAQGHRGSQEGSGRVQTGPHGPHTRAHRQSQLRREPADRQPGNGDGQHRSSQTQRGEGTIYPSRLRHDDHGPKPEHGRCGGVGDESRIDRAATDSGLRRWAD